MQQASSWAASRQWKYKEKTEKENKKYLCSQKKQKKVRILLETTPLQQALAAARSLPSSAAPHLHWKGLLSKMYFQLFWTKKAFLSKIYFQIFCTKKAFCQRHIFKQFIPENFRVPLCLSLSTYTKTLSTSWNTQNI